MLTKTKLKEELEKFPEKFTLDELIEKLILLEKIEKGERQSENGELISESELDKEVEKWFK
jgi:Zn-dependent alcohol dehydrogenase